jgi:RNA-directed DNA polymerase
MRGWRSYFGFCETPGVLISLTGWVRRRLHVPCGGNGKRSPSPGGIAWAGDESQTGGQYGRQRPGTLVPGAHQGSQRSLSKAYFRSLGLPSLFEDC